jgi:hypothetical protein
MEELTSKFELWIERDIPPFSEISNIGCCAEHEQDFAWYRQHNWIDFKNLILSSEDILENCIDLFEFCTLDARVHRYYLKGALSALETLVDEAENFSDLDFSVWQWLEHREEVGDSEFKTFVKRSEFSKDEVEDIANLVSKISQLKFNDDEDYEAVAKTLIFWNNYAKAFNS